MRRSTKQFLKFADRLDIELDKSSELFFKQRPFMQDQSLEPVMKGEMTNDDVEEKIANQYAIEELVTQINHVS